MHAKSARYYLVAAEGRSRGGQPRLPRAPRHKGPAAASFLLEVKGFKILTCALSAGALARVRRPHICI